MLKDLLPPIPVLYIRAVAVNPAWLPTSVGYLRQDPSTYECPVYLTRTRGKTFVFLSTLRSLDSTDKWVLAGKYCKGWEGLLGHLLRCCYATRDNGRVLGISTAPPLTGPTQAWRLSCKKIREFST